MDHRKYREMISSYHDGELDGEGKRQLDKHLETCPDCRREFEEMGRFEEVMRQMSLKNPNEEVWKVYWSSVYNRLERRIGWVLLSLGAIVLLFWGGVKMVEGILHDPSLPWFLKAGILAFLAGIVVLLVSLVRERFFVRQRERYKEVEK